MYTLILSKEPASKQTGRMDEPLQSCGVANRAKQALVGKHRSRRNMLRETRVCPERQTLLLGTHCAESQRAGTLTTSTTWSAARASHRYLPSFFRAHQWLQEVGHLHKQAGSLDSSQSTEINPPLFSSALGNVCVPI